MMFWTSGDEEAGAERRPHLRPALAVAMLFLSVGVFGWQLQSEQTNTFNDSHFHLTNYVQDGIDVRQYLKIMGNRVGRSTLFGIPLQQQWSYGNTGEFAPTYCSASRSCHRRSTMPATAFARSGRSRRSPMRSAAIPTPRSQFASLENQETL
jgi:hypothetical protein